MSNKYLANWLALLHQPGIGAAAFHQCLALDPELTTLPTWVKPNWVAVEAHLTWAEQPNQHIITVNDPAYPKILKEIARPPAVLFVKGNLLLINKPQIALVGSRNPTSNGVRLSFDFAIALAKAGLLITSGLALGIDASSHRGALSLPGLNTVAVLGHGLDMIYPAQHKSLAEEIVSKGVLISEFPLGVKPAAYNFPQRNRIISGLSLGVVVVEAAAKSGSLITAKFALEQGREVFAIPGSIMNIKARGCNELIQQGAKLVLTTEDIVSELGGMFNYVAVNYSKQISKSNNKIPEHIVDDRSKLLAYIDTEPIAVDCIAANSGFSVIEISDMLLQLELQGQIMSVPGGYVRCSRKKP